MSIDEDRLGKQLRDSGWGVRQHERPRDYFAPFAWVLESLLPPVGLVVQLTFTRLYANDDIVSYDHAIEISYPGEEAGPVAGYHPAGCDEVLPARILAALAWYREPSEASVNTLGVTQWAVLPTSEIYQREQRRGLEATWKQELDPTRMLDHLRHRWTDRRMTLLACAVVRRLNRSVDPHCLRAVEAAECYVEGRCNRREMRKIVRASPVAWLASLAPMQTVERSIWLFREDDPVHASRRVCDIIRDLAGDLEAPVQHRKIWPFAWHAQVVQMIAGIDLEGDFESLPVLADALEDAGCNERRLLEHLRRPEHHRGCWAFDLLRGFER